LEAFEASLGGVSLLRLRPLLCDCAVRGFGAGGVSELRIDLKKSPMGPASPLVLKRVKIANETAIAWSGRFITLRILHASYEEC
jgi:hypothetical protein